MGYPGIAIMMGVFSLSCGAGQAKTEPVREMDVSASSDARAPDGEGGARAPRTRIVPCTAPLDAESIAFFEDKFRTNRKKETDRRPPESERLEKLAVAEQRFRALSPGKERIDVGYERATLLFGLNRWSDAATAFGEIAFSPYAGHLGPCAAQLYLECLNVLGGDPRRPGCFDEIAATVPRLLQQYCHDKKEQSVEPCSTFVKLEADILESQTDQAFGRAESRGDDEGMVAAGDAYMDIFIKYCEEPIRKKESPPGIRCDHVLCSAGRAFVAAGRKERVRSVRAKFLDLTFHMERSSCVKYLTCTLTGADAGSCW